MDAIIFLGAKKSGSSRDALKVSEQKGYFTCLLTNNPKQIEDRYNYPEVHLMMYCDLNNIDSIREIINQIKNQFSICSIISFTDPYCATAALLATEYKVGKFTYQAMYKMQNKQKSRETLNETNYNPKYKVLTADNYQDYNLNIKLPVVVKYFESSGSKDVYYCKDIDSYNKYINIIFKTYPNGIVIVEEYLEGPQYLIEALVINNQPYIIAIINQEINCHNNHFIVTGYNLLTEYPKNFYLKLLMGINEIISKFNYENGPCHLEMRLVNQEWKLIEINPRISGAGMNEFLQIGLGINLVEETLNLALKYRVRVKPKYQQNTFAEYIVIDKEGILDKVTGKNRVLKLPGVRHVFVKPKKGAFLSTPTSLGNRYAYVIAVGNSEKEARDNAKIAASNIIFHIFK